MLCFSTFIKTYSISRHEDYAGLLDCAKLWFDKVHSLNPKLVSGVIVMDNFYHSGSSQVHPHLQTWLSEKYDGQFHQMYQQAALYSRDYSASYWSDLVTVHHKLGLAVNVGDVTVMAPLNSHKEHELMVVTDTVGEDFIKVFSLIMLMYHDLQLYCKSLAMSWPIYPTKNTPFVFRIGSRG